MCIYCLLLLLPIECIQNWKTVKIFVFIRICSKRLKLHNIARISIFIRDLFSWCAFVLGVSSLPQLLRYYNHVVRLSLYNVNNFNRGGLNDGWSEARVQTYQIYRSLKEILRATPAISHLCVRGPALEFTRKGRIRYAITSWRRRRETRVCSRTGRASWVLAVNRVRLAPDRWRLCAVTVRPFG